METINFFNVQCSVTLWVNPHRDTLTQSRGDCLFHLQQQDAGKQAGKMTYFLFMQFEMVSLSVFFILSVPPLCYQSICKFNSDLTNWRKSSTFSFYSWVKIINIFVIKAGVPTSSILCTMEIPNGRFMNQPRLFSQSILNPDSKMPGTLWKNGLVSVFEFLSKFQWHGKNPKKTWGKKLEKWARDYRKSRIKEGKIHCEERLTI